MLSEKPTKFNSKIVKTCTIVYVIITKEKGLEPILGALSFKCGLRNLQKLLFAL